MAPVVPSTVSTSQALFSFFIVSSLVAAAAGVHVHGTHQPGTEKTTQLHFYFQEISAGPNPSVMRVAQANTTDASPTSFGAVFVADNPLTEGPELTSRLLGRAQGVYSAASREEYALMMALNLVFVEGEYNGSALTMMGRNPIFHAAREMPIVGGSGHFRLARGYALLRTIRLDSKSGVVTVEYNVTVIHP
uniref:Dirigent protein n=1 Tax=Anthurium amnicola TaxID=1678845 RepID=A0A1D1YWC4_9ARAE